MRPVETPRRALFPAAGAAALLAAGPTGGGAQTPPAAPPPDAAALQALRTRASRRVPRKGRTRDPIRAAPPCCWWSSRASGWRRRGCCAAAVRACHPLAVVWGGLLAEHLARKQRREVYLATLPGLSRYARFLAEHRDLAARVPKRHVASHLGLTPTQLSRLRRRLGFR